MEPIKRIPYPYQALKLHEQIELLVQKGLLISDPAAVKYWLSHNSYLRFKHYSLEFKDYKNNNGNYIPETTFEKVRDLYFFDRKLRVSVFEALDNIEISIKTHISNIMSGTYGPHWYLDPQHFISSNEKYKLTKKRKHKYKYSGGFNHEKFILKLRRGLNHCFEPFFKHYKKNYEPIYPPSWIAMEVLTFGTVSLMFENLIPSAEKKQICEAFDLPKKVLISWLHCFTSIRNRCAHHNKLVYTRFNFAPLMVKSPRREFLAANNVDHTSLYAILSCIQYMLNICNNDSPFKYDLLRLFQKFPEISFNRLGFTSNWKAEKIWALHHHL